MDQTSGRCATGERIRRRTSYLLNGSSTVLFTCLNGVPNVAKGPSWLAMQRLGYFWGPVVGCPWSYC